MESSVSIWSVPVFNVFADSDALSYLYEVWRSMESHLYGVWKQNINKMLLSKHLWSSLHQPFFS